MRPPRPRWKVIRLTIPQRTKERRKDRAKQVSQLGEEGKVAIRNVRRDALKQIKKLEISENAVTAYARHGRAARPPRRLLGAEQMGRQAPGPQDGRQPAAV